jgi:hypothetical protein
MNVRRGGGGACCIGGKIFAEEGETMPRQQKYVGWVVGETALETSPSVPTGVFPSGPSGYISQPKALVDSEWLDGWKGMQGSTQDKVRAMREVWRGWIHGASFRGLSGFVSCPKICMPTLQPGMRHNKACPENVSSFSWDYPFCAVDKLSIPMILGDDFVQHAVMEIKS